MTTQEKFWDRTAQQYDEGIQAHDGLYPQTIERLLSILTPSDNVLDFGCASGEISLDIAPHVQQIYGIDVSGKMINLANQKVKNSQIPNATFEQIDIFDAQMAGRDFSAVIALNILHLVDDIEATLQRLHNLLPAGGLLIARTPCISEINWLFKSVMTFAQKLKFVPPVRYFKSDEFKSLISGSNFEVIEFEIWNPETTEYWMVARRKKDK